MFLQRKPQVPRAGLELAMELRMTLNFWTSWLYLRGLGLWAHTTNACVIIGTEPRDSHTLDSNVTNETISLEETNAAQPQLWGSCESKPEAGGTGHHEVPA